jgi:hypothetical protein
VRLRRIVLALLVLILAAGLAVAWRGFLRGERIFQVEEDNNSWYVECTYQQIGRKYRTYQGGWYTRERAEEEAWCPFIRR